MKVPATILRGAVGLALATAAWLSTSGPAVSAPIALAPGDRAPVLAGETRNAGRVVSDYSSHPATVVNFWATWCAPCRDEMPALQRLHVKLEKEGLAVIGVELDDAGAQESSKFLADLGITYPVFQGTAALTKEWGGVGILPTTFLVDRQGKVLRRYVGATPEQIRGFVADLEAVFQGRPMSTEVTPPSPGGHPATPQQPPK